MRNLRERRRQSDGTGTIEGGNVPLDFFLAALELVGRRATWLTDTRRYEHCPVWQRPELHEEVVDGVLVLRAAVELAVEAATGRGV